MTGTQIEISDSNNSKQEFPVSLTNPTIPRTHSHIALAVREHICNRHEHLTFSNINPEILSRIVKEENSDTVLQLGGVQKIAEELGSNVSDGIRGDENDIYNRKQAFGSNTYPKPDPLEGKMVLFILQECIIIWIFILVVYALLLSYIVSQGNTDWWNHLTLAFIFSCFFIIYYRTSVSRFRRAKELERILNTKGQESFFINVMRSGKSERISIQDVVVGDIVQLDNESRVPADGLFIEGGSSQLDNNVNVVVPKPSFMFSGSQVSHSHENAYMLVSAVGMNTKLAKTRSLLMSEFNELTMCQSRFKKLALCARTSVKFLKHFVGGKMYEKGNREAEKSMFDANANHPFSEIDHNTIISLVKEKKLDSLSQFGGVERIVKLLATDEEGGISGDTRQLHLRKQSFGSNTCPKLLPRKTKSFYGYLSKALFGDAVVNVLLGTFVYVAPNTNRDGWRNWWYVAFSFSILPLVIAIASAVVNYYKSKKITKMFEEGNDVEVIVLRDGEEKKISILEVVVGDIVCLKMGDLIPADGLFLRGHSLRVEIESSISKDGDSENVIDMKNPFMFSGCKVSHGIARMLVTSVGDKTLWHDMMDSQGPDFKNHIPLQTQFKRLIWSRRILGLVSTVSITVALLDRCFTGKLLEDDNGGKASNKMSRIIEMIVLALVQLLTNSVLVSPGSYTSSSLLMKSSRDLTDLILGILPERFTRGIRNVQVKDTKVISYITMGLVTTVITDELSMVKQNQIKVIEFRLNGETMMDDFSKMSRTVLDALCQGVGLSTLDEVCKQSSVDSDNPSEKALSSWGVSELSINMGKLEQTCIVHRVEAFDSEKKRRGMLIRKADNIYVHWKGAVESILPMCSNCYETDGDIKTLDEDRRMKIKQSIEVMSTSAFETVAFAYKQIRKERGSGEKGEEKQDEADTEIEEGKLEEDGLTLLGVVVLSSETRMAVNTCQNIGINIKMVSRENISKARAIAIECGLIPMPNQDEDGLVIEAKDFQKYSEMVDKVQVIAGSSSFSDKFLMVKCLQKKGNVVAVTGTGMKDARALKEADLGFSMGPRSTEVAKESSDIIMDDNFSSVIQTLVWGRRFNIFIQKLIELEGTGNITSFVINLVAVASLGQTPLTDFQMFWLKFFMIIIGHFALAESLLNEEIVKKPSLGRDVMVAIKFTWRNIFIQALFQIAISLTLVFKGQAIFGVDKAVKKALIYNTLFLFQFSHMFNVRELEKKNFLKGMLQNWLFCGLALFFHVLTLVVWPKYFGVGQLNWNQWGMCIGMAIMSGMIGLLVKWIPIPDNLMFFPGFQNGPCRFNSMVLRTMQDSYSRVLHWKRSGNEPQRVHSAVHRPETESTDLPDCKCL